jgi:hypothetical protein
MRASPAARAEPGGARSKWRNIVPAGGVNNQPRRGGYGGGPRGGSGPGFTAGRGCATGRCGADSGWGRGAAAEPSLFSPPRARSGTAACSDPSAAVVRAAPPKVLTLTGSTHPRAPAQGRTSPISPRRGFPFPPPTRSDARKPQQHISLALDALRRLALALGVTTDQLVFEEGEREVADELRLQVEAISRFDPEDRKRPGRSWTCSSSRMRRSAGLRLPEQHRTTDVVTKEPGPSSRAGLLAHAAATAAPLVAAS